MALYLDALSFRTGVETDTRAASDSIKKCVNGIAQKMALQGQDYVNFDVAVTLSNECFRGRTTPEGKTWLDVLIQTSVFRRDPAPFSKEIDPFDPPSERIRFAFQRFQDHLMVNVGWCCMNTMVIGKNIKMIAECMVQGMKNLGFFIVYS